MVIKVDTEGQEMVKQLCDIALRAGGLSNMEGVWNILRAIKLETEKVEEKQVN